MELYCNWQGPSNTHSTMWPFTHFQDLTSVIQPVEGWEVRRNSNRFPIRPRQIFFKDQELLNSTD